MRAGKPVIGCTAGGMPEVVAHNECGLLIPPDDAVALANAIIQLARSETLRMRFGEAGRTRFSRFFSVERMAQQSNDVYLIARALHRKEPPSA